MRMLKTFHRPLLGIAAAAFSLISLSAHAVSQYKITDIGVPMGGTYFHAEALNDNGTIIGFGNNATTNSGAFLWSGGTFTALNQLSYVGGINNAGTIVGSSAGQAVALKQGTVTALPNLLGASVSSARSVNQAGVIAGTSGKQAVIWKNGQVQALGEAPAEGMSQSVIAINDNGVVLGTSGPTYGPGARNLLLWNPDGTVTELGEPPVGFEPSAYDLNNAGTVVGVSQGIHSLDPVVWRNGVAEVLPKLGYADGEAHAVNDAGLIVGASVSYSDTQGVATLWQDGQAYNLNDLLVGGPGPFNLVDAIDINASGQILVGTGWGGGDYVYLLTPVPEPSTYALFGLGLLSLALVRRKPSSAAPNPVL